MQPACFSVRLFAAELLLLLELPYSLRDFLFPCNCTVLVICMSCARMLHAVFKGKVMVERRVKLPDTNKPDELVLLVLQPGSFFGYSGMNQSNGKWEGWRFATVRALEVCHVFSLGFDDFNSAIRMFPEYRNLLEVCPPAVVFNVSQYVCITIPYFL